MLKYKALDDLKFAPCEATSAREFGWTKPELAG
jgi:hypothetical protein